MSLSLYLLLSPPIDPEASIQARAATQGNTQRYTLATLDPARWGSTRRSCARQASRCRPAAETKSSLNALKLGFAARVVFDAMGFLLMTSGLLLLLQIAQATLS